MGKLLQPEPDPGVKPRRAELVALVADIEVVFPYAGDDVCKKCGRALSRYNPHIICYACIHELRLRVADPEGRAALVTLLNKRRPRNRRTTDPRSVNAPLLEQAGTAGYRTGGHRPQHGHS